jgi:hypothetical protein
MKELRGGDYSLRPRLNRRCLFSTHGALSSFADSGNRRIGRKAQRAAPGRQGRTRSSTLRSGPVRVRRARTCAA